MIGKHLKIQVKQSLFRSNDLMVGNFYAFTLTSTCNSTRSKIKQGKKDSKEPRALTVDEEVIPLKIVISSVKDWKKSIRFGISHGISGSETPLIQGPLCIMKIDTTLIVIWMKFFPDALGYEKC